MHLSCHWARSGASVVSGFHVITCLRCFMTPKSEVDHVCSRKGMPWAWTSAFLFASSRPGSAGHFWPHDTFLVYRDRTSLKCILLTFCQTGMVHVCLLEWWWRCSLRNKWWRRFYRPLSTSQRKLFFHESCALSSLTSKIWMLFINYNNF